MRQGPAHIQELIHAIRGLAGHLDQVRRDEGLLGDVRARLPVSVRSHCLQAVAKDGVLILTLDSPSWATRARYLERDLLGALATAGIIAVKIQIRPIGRSATRRAAKPVFGAARLKPETISHILEAAEHIADPGLAEALRRLARSQSPGAGV